MFSCYVEYTSIKEHTLRESDIVDEIIALGKKCGLVTYDQLHEAFPAESFPIEQLEEIMELLSDMGIDIIDTQEDISSLEDDSEKRDTSKHQGPEEDEHKGFLFHGVIKFP